MSAAPISMSFIASGLESGGAEIMLYRLLKRIDRTEFAPEVISLARRGAVADQIAALGIPVHCLDLGSIFSLPKAVFKLLRLIRASRPDLLHGWMYHGNAAAAFAKIAAPKARLIWSIHHTLDDLAAEKRGTRLVIRLCARLSNWASAIHYVSEKGMRQHQALGYDDRRARCIPNGVDTEEFSRSGEARMRLREAIGAGDDSLVIGMLARYHPVKDHENFLNAAARLDGGKRDLHFVLAGRGIDEGNEPLLGRIRELGLRSRTHLLGERRDIPCVLNGLDILVVSSRCEAFPLILCEAMACEVPCITTDVGDAATVVGTTGLVVPPKNAPRLAQALAQLIAMDQPERQSLGQAARNSVTGHYSLDAIGHAHQQMYRQVVLP